MEFIKYHSTTYILESEEQNPYLLINVLDKIIYHDTYLNIYLQATSHQLLLPDAALQTKELHIQSLKVKPP